MTFLSKGDVALGAPDLPDEVWLWGGRREQIRDTVLFGRRNHMPAHAPLISDDERRVVAGYVLSLSADATRDAAGGDHVAPVQAAP